MCVCVCVCVCVLEWVSEWVSECVCEWVWVCVCVRVAWLACTLQVDSVAKRAMAKTEKGEKREKRDSSSSRSSRERGMDVNRGAERRRTSIWNLKGLRLCDGVVSSVVKALEVTVMEVPEDGFRIICGITKRHCPILQPLLLLLLPSHFNLFTHLLWMRKASWHTFHTNTPPPTPSLSLTFSVSHFPAMVVCFAAQWDAIVTPLTFLCVCMTVCICNKKACAHPTEQRAFYCLQKLPKHSV